MKKKYINPTLSVVEINTIQMIATSVGFGDGTMDGSAAASREDDLLWEENDGSRRHNNVWDEEEEYNEYTY